MRTSLIRVSSGAGPHTATITRTDTLRRRWITDDAPKLQQRQSTWSISQDAVEEKARRRPLLVTDELASTDNRRKELDGQTTDNFSQLSGWSGDPEVAATPLFSKVNRGFSHKYFVGKRHRSHNDDMASGLSLTQPTDTETNDRFQLKRLNGETMVA